MIVSEPRWIDDLRREITREEYEADRLANPIDEDGDVRPTWEELCAVKLEASIGEWRGFTFKAD